MKKERMTGMRLAGIVLIGIGVKIILENLL